ncbi:MAG: hypothetical protein ACQESR_09250 [Planctomycetota bacterium]
MASYRERDAGTEPSAAMPEPEQALTHEEVRTLDVKSGHGGKRRIRNGNSKHLLIATVRVTL